MQCKPSRSFVNICINICARVGESYLKFIQILINTDWDGLFHRPFYKFFQCKLMQIQSNYIFNSRTFFEGWKLKYLPLFQLFDQVHSLFFHICHAPLPADSIFQYHFQYRPQLLGVY